MNKVLVTNDITLQVALDAVAQKASVIVSYRATRPPLRDRCGRAFRRD